MINDLQKLIGRRLRCGEDAYVEFTALLGLGASGAVYKVMRVRRQPGSSRSQKQPLAAKVIDIRQLHMLPEWERERDKLKREVSILASICHTGVVNLHGVIDTEDMLILLMDLVDGGELFNKVSRGPLRELEARYVFTQVAHTLKFLHEQGVIHRDLKLENVLVAAEPAPRFYEVRVADFGLSKAIVGNLSRARSYVGTPQYWAPEVIMAGRTKKSYSFAADIWSLGCLLYVLVAGQYPFNCDTDWETEILQGEVVFGPPFANISQDCKDLILNMLRVNPDQRYGLREILGSRWMSMPFPPGVPKLPPLHKQNREPLLMNLGPLFTGARAQSVEFTGPLSPEPSASSSASSSTSSSDSRTSPPRRNAEREHAAARDEELSSQGRRNRAARARGRRSKNRDGKPPEYIDTAGGRRAAEVKACRDGGDAHGKPQYHQRVHRRDDDEEGESSSSGSSDGETIRAGDEGARPRRTQGAAENETTRRQAFSCHGPPRSPQSNEDEAAFESTDSYDDQQQGANFKAKTVDVTAGTNVTGSRDRSTITSLADAGEAHQRLHPPPPPTRPAPVTPEKTRSRQRQEHMRSITKLFNSAELLELLVSAFYRFHQAYVVFRGQETIAPQIRVLLGDLKEVTLGSRKVFLDINMTCSAIKDLLETVRICVEEEKPEQAVDMFENLQTWVVEVLTSAQSLRTQYSSVLSKASALIAAVRDSGAPEFADLQPSHQLMLETAAAALAQQTHVASPANAAEVERAREAIFHVTSVSEEAPSSSESPGALAAAPAHELLDLLFVGIQSGHELSPAEDFTASNNESSRVGGPESSDEGLAKSSAVELPSTSIIRHRPPANDLLLGRKDPSPFSTDPSPYLRRAAVLMKGIEGLQHLVDVLEQWMSFWDNLLTSLKMVNKFRDQTVTMLRCSVGSARQQERLMQRLKNYEEFWDELETESERFVEGSRKSAATMRRFVANFNQTMVKATAAANYYAASQYDDPRIMLRQRAQQQSGTAPQLPPGPRPRLSPGGGT